MKKLKSVKIDCINHFRVDFNINNIVSERFTENIVHYNENGKVIKEEQYAMSDELDYVLLHEYNEKGQLTSTSQYNGEHLLIQKTDFSHDEDGTVIQQDNYYGEDTIAYTQKFVYEGNLFVKQDVYEKGHFIFTEKNFTYNDQNLVSEETEFDEDGKILYITKFEYGEDGVLLKRVREEMIAKDLRTYEYEYDDNRNKTKELIYNFDGVLIAKAYYCYNEEGQITEKEEEDLDNYQKIVYHYTDKELSKIETFNQAGKMISWTEYLYGEDHQVLSLKHYGTDETDENTYRIRMEYHYEREYYNN